MPNRAALTPFSPPHLPIKPIILATILLGLVSAPAFAQALTIAEAVTYTGTVGGQAIVVELTDLKDGPVLGRYSYQNNGADIPLHALGNDQSDIVLAEEAPCTPALCVRADDNLVLDPPLAGQFSLHYSPDGATMTGTWRASASDNDELPVTLTRFGQRTYDRDDAFPYGSFLWMNYGGAGIMPDTSPYDYAKMQVPLAEGPLQAMGGATLHEVTDPRTKFAFPRIVSLPGGGDIGPINAALDQQRWATNFSGFECLSMDYLSGVWMPLPFGTGGASLGGIDQDHISIDHLSDTVMTIRQASRNSCGGGAPYDYVSYYTYDVRAGHALDLSHIFKDWDATSNDPTQKLIDWVSAAYRKAPGYDASRDSGCASNDNLADGLDVSFAQDDVAVFLIGDIEDTACMGVIVTMPLAAIRDLLTDEAADYFPSLRS
jgi:hypothetical protein